MLYLPSPPVAGGGRLRGSGRGAFGGGSGGGGGVVGRRGLGLLGGSVRPFLALLLLEGR